ncbi:type VI secretion system tube protein Hcp [Luteolibacter marinus]|uniref:type VI secretion system tube protein Hcp n=1 Tax=Luteolibacter marinus TaxID=2776705 RepID=UPI001866FD6C|nr:type VI secretion system tube protein Hcp [Luteolibacter marinus]
MSLSGKSLLGGLAVAAWVAVVPAARAEAPTYQAWIRFGDGIPGEATDPGHEGWTAVETLSTAVATDGFALTCHRRIDKSTPLLMGACADGSPFPEVRVDIARYQDGVRQDFWELILHQVLIVACDQSAEPPAAAGGEDPVPTETLTLNWQSASVTYRVYPPGAAPYDIKRLVSADGDGDGLPDAYESSVGLDPASSNHDTDSDGDGLLDTDEYRLGTDPRDATSFFQIMSSQLDPDSGQLILTWPSVSGEEYQIDYSPDLATPFAPHATVIATGPQTTRSVPRQLASGFFRVRHGSAP